MKRIFVFFAVICCMMVANANEDATLIDGIYYILDGNSRTATVTWGGEKYHYDTEEYTGIINIPAKVKHNDIEFDVTSIGDYAFHLENDVTLVNIPSSVTRIGIGAFAVSSLTSIIIPSSVTSIGYAALTGNNWQAIVVEAGNTVYDCRDNCNALIETATNTLLAGSASTVIPQNVIKIGYGAFANSEITSITIPASVTEIGDDAFLSCENLTSITVHALVPPTLGMNEGVFDSSIKEIPVNVIDAVAYQNSIWGTYFTNFVGVSVDEYKQSALTEINEALRNTELTTEEQNAYDSYLSIINNVTEETENLIKTIYDAKVEALATIHSAKVRIARTSAIADIEAAMQGETGAYITSMAETKITLINSMDDPDAILIAGIVAVELITTATEIYNAAKTEILGTLGEKQNGPAIIVTDQNGKEIILYSTKKVQYIKVND